MEEADVKRQSLRPQGQNQRQNSLNLELMTRLKRHQERWMKNRGRSLREAVAFGTDVADRCRMKRQ